MSRQNSREGMERIRQDYQGSGSVDRPTGYPVPFGHFPWNFQPHQSVPGPLCPPVHVVPGQHGNRGSEENIVNFYKNLSALQDGLGEQGRNYTGEATSLSRVQQPQVNYPSNNIPSRFPPPLISDRLESSTKEKAMKQRPYFPVPNVCHPTRHKPSQENRMPRNLQMPNSIGGSMLEPMGYPGMPFPQAPSEYSYPTLSRMLEIEGNFGRGPHLQCSSVPPWIPQLNQSQSIPHLANFVPPQVTNSSPNLISDRSVPRKSPVESFPEETTSPGLIGRWYKLPTEDDKTALSVNMKKESDSVQPSAEKVTESVKDSCQTAANISQNLPPTSGSADSRLGRLQELVDRLRSSKEGCYDKKNTKSTNNVSRETITISPEMSVQESPLAQTLRISPDIPGMPSRTEQVSNKTASTADLVKPNDSVRNASISILNSFSLNYNDTEEPVPIIIDDENSQPPSESIIAGDLGERPTDENSETFLPPRGSSTSEFIIPASTLTIEANKISCSQKSSLQNGTLSVTHVKDSLINSSEHEASKDDAKNKNAISVTDQNIEIEKLVVKDNPKKESNQIRIKLKMSCTSESGIICRFSKIASAGLTSKHSENIVRGSPDTDKTPTTTCTTPQTESGTISVQVEPKQHSKNTNSLLIKTSSLFQNVQKTNREKKTMHVQPLQQVLQNSVTATVAKKTDSMPDSPTKVTEEPNASDKQHSKTVNKCLDSAVSTEEDTSKTLSENVPIESSADIVNNVEKSVVNIDKTVSLSSELCVPLEPVQTSNSSEMDNTISSCIPSVEESAIEVTGNLFIDVAAKDGKASSICGSDSQGSQEVTNDVPDLVADSDIIQKLSTQQVDCSTSYSQIKINETPRAKIIKRVKQSKRKKRAKIVGRRICRSSSKHFKPKKESNNVSQSDGSYSKPVESVHETDVSVEDLHNSHLAVTKCISSLHKQTRPNTNMTNLPGEKPQSAVNLFTEDPTEALEVVYRSCMKSIEIPSNRSYYSSKIFKKKNCGSKMLNKKYKKKMDIPLTPDRIMPILFVKFHGKRLMCLKMTNGKYLIMREFLKCCFSFKDPHQGMRKYKQIFLAKERDLNIPYVELCTNHRERVVQYLKDEGHLLVSCKASHVGIITVPDALRLYHFFKGVKLCGNVCVEDEDREQISDEGFLAVSSEARLHAQRATDKAVDTSQSLDTNQQCHSQTKLKETTNVPSSISDGVVESSCDKGVNTSQDNLSDLEQGYQSDDSDATIPYIEGIALKRRHLEDIRSIKSKHFKRKKNSSEKDSVVRGGIAELYEYVFRFIVLDEKKFVPFEDLCFSFEEKDVYDIVQKSCFQVYDCSSAEVTFLNNLDSNLPKLWENNSMVVEEDVLHAFAGNARSILQNFFKCKWQKLRQNNKEPEMSAVLEKLPKEVNDSVPGDRIVDEKMPSTYDDVMTTESLIHSPSTSLSLSDSPATTTPLPTTTPPLPQPDNDSSVEGAIEDQWLASQQVMTKAFLALMKQNIAIKDRISDLDKEVKTMKEQRQSMDLLVKKYEEMLAVFREECG